MQQDSWETIVEKIRNNAVTELDLSKKHLRGEGASALAEALAANHSLQELHLSVNYVGDEGCLAITNVLIRNTSLCKLDL